jgi:hypothetical protein
LASVAKPDRLVPQADGYVPSTWELSLNLVKLFLKLVNL